MVAGGRRDAAAKRFGERVDERRHVEHAVDLVRLDDPYGLQHSGTEAPGGARGPDGAPAAPVRATPSRPAACRPPDGAG